MANALRLLQLPDEVAEMVAEGRLSAAMPGRCCPFPRRSACPAAQEAAEKGLTVRELERRAKAARAPKKNSPATAFSRDSFYHEVELALTEQMGRRVRVSEKNGGGLLQIEFYDQEDLRSLANRLSPEMEP